MSLPYENATSGNRALDEIQRVLTSFGASRFGTMTDNEKGEVLVQFTYRGRDVSIRASVRGYAAAWLREHPYNPSRNRKTRVEHERAAMAQAQVSVCSVLRDWVKGQITAVEVGLLSFDGAFLGQILLPTGRTLMEAVEQQEWLPQLEAPK